MRDAALGWVEHNAPRLSAALAFYTILSVSPLLVIATAIVGAVFGDAGASDQLIKQLQAILGEPGAEVVRAIIENSSRPALGAIASALGTVTLLVGASGVFSELQSALNTVWNVKPKPNLGIWSILRYRFLSFGVVLAVGFLLIVTVVLSTAVAAFGGELQGIVPNLALSLQITNSVLSFALLTVLFALIFKFLPDVKVWWRDVLFGALVTAILFAVGRFFIGLYLGSAGIATPFGAAGSLVVFVVWIYYSSLILFFGVELTQVTATRLGHNIEPTSKAEWVETRTSQLLDPNAKTELDGPVHHPLQRKF